MPLLVAENCCWLYPSSRWTRSVGGDDFGGIGIVAPAASTATAGRREMGGAPSKVHHGRWGRVLCVALSYAIVMGFKLTYRPTTRSSTFIHHGTSEKLPKLPTTDEPRIG